MIPRPSWARGAADGRSRSVAVAHAPECLERLERERRKATGLCLRGLNGSRCLPDYPRRLALQNRGDPGGSGA